jgi:hypothetical protein
MFTQTFDELTKKVATVTSRRQVFKVLAGAVAAVAGTLLSSRAAEAAEEHLCCVYRCPDNFAHRCIRLGENDVPVCPSMDDCGLVSTSVTTKCSDCGSNPGVW